jgi:pimeloyl-ACP methyl ester carboxylesterase
MTTYVLVHGAWHGGWCWQRVTRLLQDKGHTVHAPTLTGVGERSHLSNPAINLTTHVLDVTNEIRWKELEALVLVGHSYGGMVITGAAGRLPGKIASIVYLDAFLPADGQSLYDILGQEHEAENGLVKPLPAEFFHVNARDRAWVDRMTTPQSAACFAERLNAPAALASIARKTFVKANLGVLPPIQANYARLINDPAWQCHELECGHDVMIDKPEEVVRILLDAA